MSLRRTATTCLLLVGALLTTGLVDATPAGAATTGRAVSAVSSSHVAGVSARRKKKAKKPRTPKAPTVPGQPPRSYAIPRGSVFSFPNRGDAEAKAIRQRVLYTIQSVWGAPRDPATHVSGTGAGTIRLATWSFDDWAVAKALVAARNRGVSVQVVAAAGKNKHMAPWRYLRKKLKARPFPPGRPDLADRTSFARVCRGSCRGPGGTAHAKYFLFDNVGAAHERAIVVNTSMNLTQFAYEYQWNHATTWHDSRVYADFLSVFREARAQVRSGYHAKWLGGGIGDYFFPRPGTQPADDPVMRYLGPVGCRGATWGGNPWGYTRIRVIQYAIYSDRGLWIAKRLRQLWEQGCDVRVIYSVASRPVLKVLRNKHGRGPIPMRQSVILDARGDYEKYNHSKWMTITGRWGTNTGAWVTFTGSANWADLALTSDEQMQTIQSVTWALPFLAAFDKTWKQRSSRRPPRVHARMSPEHALARELVGAPRHAPAFGRGVFRHMEED